MHGKHYYTIPYISVCFSINCSACSKVEPFISYIHVFKMHEKRCDCEKRVLCTLQCKARKAVASWQHWKISTSGDVFGKVQNMAPSMAPTTLITVWRNKQKKLSAGKLLVHWDDDIYAKLRHNDTKNSVPSVVII